MGEGGEVAHTAGIEPGKKIIHIVARVPHQAWVICVTSARSSGLAVGFARPGFSRRGHGAPSRCSKTLCVGPRQTNARRNRFYASGAGGVRFRGGAGAWLWG